MYHFFEQSFVSCLVLACKCVCVFVSVLCLFAHLKTVVIPSTLWVVTIPDAHAHCFVCLQTRRKVPSSRYVFRPKPCNVCQLCIGPSPGQRNTIYVCSVVTQIPHSIVYPCICVSVCRSPRVPFSTRRASLRRSLCVRVSMLCTRTHPTGSLSCGFWRIFVDVNLRNGDWIQGFERKSLGNTH